MGVKRLSTKRSSSYFLISMGVKRHLFIQSGPIKLNSSYYLKRLQEQLLPIHSSFFIACNVNTPRPLGKAENWTKMQAGRKWSYSNKYFDTKERSCYNLVFAVSIVFYQVLNLHERQLCWNTDLIVLFGTRSKPAILLPIFEHGKSHSLKTQRLVNNFKPSCRCIAPFPAIIQPDKCHVSHCKQREITLAWSG